MTLPRTGLGTTSLGAIGGPRGIAAGGLRILIEFISQYDSTAVKQLEADLATLESTQNRLGRRAISTEAQLERATRKRAEAENILAAAIKNSEKAAQTSLTRSKRGIEAGLVGSPSQRKQARSDFKQLVLDLQSSGRLTDAEARKVAKLLTLRSQEKAALTSKLRVQQSITNATEQEVIVTQQLSRFQQLKAGLGAKLGGLALGGIGALVGGAIIGAGFAAAQAAIDAIGSAIQDIIDPARHARESIKDLETQVQGLADKRDISRLAAIKEILRDLGIQVDDTTASLLSQALVAQKANEQIAERIKLEDILQHIEALQKSNIDDLTKSIIDQARAEGKRIELIFTGHVVTDTLIDGVSALTLAHEAYKRILEELGAVQQEDINLKNRQAAATFALKLAQDSLNAAAQAYTQSRSSAIDDQIAAVREQGGESARTRNLRKKLDSLQGGGGSGIGQQLANIAEERALILLRQRLRLLGTNINLEKFSGKFLLEAINAKLKALQKEAAAQDRLNKLLDLQYRMSQTIKRQQGETINDFLERRAQENRNLLTEQQNLERDKAQEALQDLQDRTQDEVKLKELSEQRKTTLAQAGSSTRTKLLQAELKASQDADRKALDAKIKALEAQKKALEDAAKDAVDISSREHQLELQNYIAMSKTLNQLALVSGEIRGLEQAKEFLKAVLSSGFLPPEQSAAIKAAIAGIMGTLSAYTRKFNLLTLGPRGANLYEKEQKYGFASGAVFPLRNSMNPFGNNVRVGEQGTEWGAVFPNKLVNRLSNMRGNQTFGDINVYATEDPLAAAYRMKQTIREVIREEIRG